jgi:2-hydroxychromene-2-carboxylate isomerase
MTDVVHDPIDWYFDFVSPFAYLQWRLIRRDRPELQLVPKPVLLAGLLRHAGQLGPAEIPSKRRSTYRHVQWLAHEYGVPMRFPPAHPFNPLPALRLSLAAMDRVVAVDAIFAHLWEQGLAGDTADALAPVGARIGIADVATAISADAVKLELAQNGEKAIALGVFGVPTLEVGGQLFWGNDATGMALAYLRDGTLFDAPEMRRLDDLPIAAQRVVATPPRPGAPADATGPSPLPTGTPDA